MYSDTKTELRTIKLSGFLGKKFGRVHRLAVDSPAEAIRALSVNINGFREFLENSHKNGVAYRFLVVHRRIGGLENQPASQVR